MGQLRAAGATAGQLHLRNLHPLPPGLREIFLRYKDVLVVEMNDEGLYGYGQLAMLLRARYALPSIGSITKTDGLTFRISEIVNRVTQARAAHAGANGTRT